MKEKLKNLTYRAACFAPAKNVFPCTEYKGFFENPLYKGAFIYYVINLGGGDDKPNAYIC